MVRNMVGTLLWVGRGRLTPDDVTRLLEGKDRSQCPPGALPHGLFLHQVHYPSHLLLGPEEFREWEAENPGIDPYKYTSSLHYDKEPIPHSMRIEPPPIIPHESH